MDIENEKKLKGANFGWDHFEGDHRFNGDGDNEAPRPSRKSYEPPVHEYSHSQGNVITGGVVVRDDDLNRLNKRYVYADFGSDKLRSFEVKLSGARKDRSINVSITDPSSFASGPDGTVYVTTLSGGAAAAARSGLDPRRLRRVKVRRAMEPTAATQRTSSKSEASGNGKSPAAETFEVLRPADGSLMQTLDVATPEQVAETVARVRAAQPAWEAIGVKGRRRWLEQWRDWLLDNRERIGDIVQAETGKVRGDSGLESVYLELAINFWGQHGEEYLADETPKAGLLPTKVRRLRVRYRPYPVVGIISPWNFPLILSAGDAIPALWPEPRP